MSAVRVPTGAAPPRRGFRAWSAERTVQVAGVSRGFSKEHQEQWPGQVCVEGTVGRPGWWPRCLRAVTSERALAGAGI